MKEAKRMVSLIVVCAMILTMMPANAVAFVDEDANAFELVGGSVEYNAEQDQVVEIKFVGIAADAYTSLVGQFDTCAEEDTIVLQQMTAIYAVIDNNPNYAVDINTGAFKFYDVNNPVSAGAEEAIITASYIVPAGTAPGDYGVSMALSEAEDDELPWGNRVEDVLYTATITVEDAPAAPASDYTVFYTLTGNTAGTVSGFKGYEVTPGEDNLITATVYMVSNNATVTMQAYDIYLSYDPKLSFVSESLTGKAYGADGTEIKTAGGAVTHIQLVADDGKYVTLPEDEATSLGTIVFDIDDVTAEYAEQLEITLSSSTNIAVADDKGSKTPAVSGGDKGAQVINTYDVTYAANGDGVSNMPDAQKKLYNTPLTLGAAPSRTGHTFAGWSDGTNTYEAGHEYTLNEPLALTAQWTPNAVTVTWNIDGDETEQAVDYGTVPSYTGTPTKESSAQYNYAFAGWSATAGGEVLSDLPAATGNVTYYAVFEATTRKYTITFVNEGGAELQSSEVAYGETPAYTGETPTKAGTAQYTYTFKGWTPEIVAVAGEATYTATYSSSVNKYTIKFVNEGGTVLQSSEVEYGQTPTYTGETPTKAADAQYTYTFKGWTPSIAAVNGEATYTATYDKTVNKYTITFVNEDKTVLQSSEVEYDKTPVYEGATPTKDPTTEKVFTFDKWSPEIVAVTGEATYTATYTEEARPYTVSFQMKGHGTQIENKTVKYGSTVEKPAEPVAAGYTFGGWYTDDACTNAYNFENEIIGDVTLYAKWTANKYYVQFNGNGATAGSMDNQEFTYDVARNLTANAFAKTGFNFNGWSTVQNPGANDTRYGDKAEVKNLAESGTVILYAQWTENPHNVTAATNLTGGTVSAAPTSGKEGDTITVTVIPDTGYQVSNVTYKPDVGEAVEIVAEEGVYKFTMPNADVTVSAVFEKINYTVTVTEPQNGTVTAAPTTATMGSTVTLTVTPSAGYKLTALAYNGNTITVEEGQKTYTFTMPNADVTVTAAFDKADLAVNIQDDIEKGTVSADKETAQLGETVTLTVTPNEGYELDELTVAGPQGAVDVDSNNQFTMPAGEVTVTATFKPINYTIRTEGENGSIGVAGTPNVGETITLTVTPNTGYKLTGYVVKDASGNDLTVNDNQFTMPADDVTVTATFDPISYTIKFAGGTGAEGSASDIPATYDSNVTLPGSGFTKNGYTLTGWTDGNTEYGLGASVKNLTAVDNGSVTLTAVWTATVYSITYVENDGAEVADGSYTIESETVTLPTSSTREHYTFGGWYDNADLTGNAVTTIAQGSTGNKTFYAKWTPVPYTIVYELNGGTNAQSNPAEYTIESETITLAAPSKAGYTFDGWYDNEGLTGEKVTTIAQGSTGDKTFYAKWTATQYTITFVTNGGTEIALMTYKITDNTTLPTTSKANYKFQNWIVSYAQDYTEKGWGEAGATVADKTPVAGYYGNVTLTAVWAEGLTYQVESFKYAENGFVLLRVEDNLTADQVYKFGEEAMYYISDAYQFEGSTKGVFYTLISVSDVESETDNEGKVTYTGKLTADGYEKLKAVKGDRVTIDYNGDINGDEVINIADANVVYQMIQNGGGYYSSLDVLARLKADMDRNDAAGSAHATITDVNAILAEINGTAPAEDGAQ